MKFGGDEVDEPDLEMDVWLSEHGYTVRYDIIPHPLSGKVTPKGDLSRLSTRGIPYLVWGLKFWRLGRGEGLRMPLTWAN